MAFDRNDAAQLAELKSEVTVDPVTQGYNPDSTQGGVLDLLNIAANNNGPTVATRDIDDVTVPEVSEIIDPTEYAALTEYDKVWVNTFINQDGAAIRPYKAKFLAIFPNGTATFAAAIALLDVPNSDRGDVLWGSPTTITSEDWFAARDS